MPPKEPTIEDIKKPGFNPASFLDDVTPANPDDLRNPPPEDDNKKKEDEKTTNDIKNEPPAPQPPAKTKEDNIKALKQAKEAAEKELAETKAENEKLKKLKSLEKIRNYLSEKNGGKDVSDEEVDAYIAKNKSRKEELEKLSQSYKEKDQALREFSIEHSDEWKDVYQKKIVQTSDILRTAILNVDSSGNVRGPKSTQKFIQTIVALKEEDGKKRPLTPIEIKSALAAFRKEFEEEAGIDYEPPTLSELVKSTEEFHAAVTNASTARANWNKTLEENKKARLYEESKRREQEIKQEVEGRNFLVSKLKDNEELKQLKEFVGDELDTYIAEEHNFMNDALLGKDIQRRGYDTMIATMAKAKSVPKLLLKIKELQDQYDNLKDSIDGDNSRSPGSRSTQRDMKKTEEGGIKLKPGENFDPAGFLG